MVRLSIVGWREGLLKVSMTKLLQEHLGIGLREAKQATDAVLEGRIICYELEESQAEALAKALDNVGAIIEISDRD